MIVVNVYFVAVLDFSAVADPVDIDINFLLSLLVFFFIVFHVFVVFVRTVDVLCLVVAICVVVIAAVFVMLYVAADAALLVFVLNGVFFYHLSLVAL